MTGPAGPLAFAPRLTMAVLGLPVLAGLAGTLAPAFGLSGDGEAPFASLTAWPGFWPALRLTLVTGLVSTAIALSLALLITASLAGSRGFALLRRLLSPLLALPHAAAALGLAFLIAPSGWIARALSPWATGWQVPPDLLLINDPAGIALTLGLIAKELPFLLLMSLAALPQCDAARRQTLAASLGYGRIAGFVLTVLPPLYRQLRLPGYAVLAYAMTSVDMAIVLGPTRPPTLAVQITRWMTEPGLTQRGTAAAGALVLLALVLAALAAWRLVEPLAKAALCRAAMGGLRMPGIDAPLAVLARVSALALSLSLIAGLAGLALWSFAGLWPFPRALPESLSLDTWRRAAPGLCHDSLITLAIAATATLAALALVLASLEAEHRGARALSPWLIYLPLLLPQLSFLPGLSVLWLGLGAPPGIAAVALAHLVFVLPYVWLSLSAPFRAWDGRIATLAATLGASQTRVFWHLRLPMLLAAILTATALGLAVSVGQYLPTLLIGGGRITTLTTEALALSSGGNRRLIGAYALLQLALPALGFALAIGLPRLIFRHRRGMGLT